MPLNKKKHNFLLNKHLICGRMPESEKRLGVLLGLLIRNTMSSTSSAIITPIMMYMFSVRPPAQRGPRMVASPPTERRTPWLNPAGESATTFQT